MKIGCSVRQAAQGALLALLAACGGSTGSESDLAGIEKLNKPGVAQTSSPIAISRDDATLVAVNTESDSISIFKHKGGDVTRLAEVPVGKEPRGVALGALGKKAYVACSEEGTVDLIDVLARKVIKTIAVGKEPRAIILSPNQTSVYVANSVSNTISEIDTETLAVKRTVDIPESIGLQPRALAVTSDRDFDDTDEKLYVACYFGAPRAGRTGLDEGQDDQREGRIAVLATSDLSLLTTIALQPLDDTGFASNGSVLEFVGTIDGAGGVNATDPANPAVTGHPTPAFPNQLASLALHPKNGKGYVVSTGASPNGPFAFNSNAQGLASVIDTASDTEVVSPDLSNVIHQRAPLNLDRGLKQDLSTVPVLFHTQPTGVAWAPNGAEAWICIGNSDVLVRMEVDANGIPTLNAPVANGGSSIKRVDLQTPSVGLLPCKSPQGLVLDSDGKRAFVLGFVSRTVSVVGLVAGSVVDTEISAALPPAGSLEEQIHLGTELFFTGRGPDGRMSNESWGACTVCHPDGLADGVTWMFDAGPRQTIPLDGMFDFDDVADQRVLNWSAVRDENHDFELNTRGVFGGRGLIDDDRLLFTWGGSSGGSDLAEALEYHQFTNVFGNLNDLAGQAALPTLPSARRDYAAATLLDGRVLIVGGRAGAGDGSLFSGVNSVLLFDPRANTLVARNSGFTPRHSLGAAGLKTASGFKVYAVGGYTSTAVSTAPTDLVEEYDVATDTWRVVAPLPVASAEFGITTTGPHNKGEPIQRMHVLGGNTGSLQTPSVSGSIFVFAPDAGIGAWKTLTFGISPRRKLGAAGVVRGVLPFHVFAIGGRDASGTALTTVEAYVGTTSQAAPADPTSLVATPLTQLAAGRHSFAIGTSNNRIYVMGGIDGSGADLASTFELNPGNNPSGGTPGALGVPSGTITAKADLPSARSGFQVSNATPIQNFEPIANRGRDSRQDAINLWIQNQVRPLAAKNDASAPLVATGRALFDQPGLTGVSNVSCTSCHGGAKWTRSIVDYTGAPSPDLTLGSQEVIGAELRKTATQPGTLPENGVLVDVGTFDPIRLHEVRVNPADVGNRVVALGANGFNIPSLVGVGTSSPYFHDGIAFSLDAVLNGSADGLGASTLRTVHRVLDPNDRAALVEFLESIDGDTVTFP